MQSSKIPAMARLHIETPQPRQATTSLPQFGIAEGTTVLTLDGVLPVEFLTPGDRIVTRGAIRRLKAVEMSLVRDVRLVRVAANVFGTGRPDAPVRLVPGQPILLRDWRAQALYGQHQALVAVSRLSDGEYVRGRSGARGADLHAEARRSRGDLCRRAGDCLRGRAGRNPEANSAAEFAPPIRRAP